MTKATGYRRLRSSGKIMIYLGKEDGGWVEFTTWGNVVIGNSVKRIMDEWPNHSSSAPIWVYEEGPFKGNYTAEHLAKIVGCPVMEERPSMVECPRCGATFLLRDDYLCEECRASTSIR